MRGKWSVLAALILMSVGLSSCVSNPLSPGFAFSELGDDALMVIKARRTTVDTTINFMRADLQNQRFLGGLIHVPIFTLAHSRHLVGPDRRRQPTEFFVERVKPGDYAFIGSSVSGAPYKTQINCNTYGAPVFRMEGGRANLIDLSGGAGDPFRVNAPKVGPGIKKADIDRLTHILTRHPKMKSEVVQAKAVAVIGFESREIPLGRACPKGNSFVLSRGQHRSN